jgi:hypothetical protein
MIVALVFLVELLISVTVFIWIAATLGFADDAHRNQKATVAGKILVVSGVVLASLPFIATLYVGWQYYFSENFYEKMPLGWWFPILVAVISFAGGRRIAKRYDTSYKKKK